MSGIKLKGDTTGEILLDVPAVAGTNTLTLPATTGNIVTTGDSSTITQGMIASNVAGTAPAFHASFIGNQTIPNAVFEKLQFNKVIFDTNSNFDSTTNYRFTPNVAGYYLFIAQAQFNLLAASGQNILALYKNGGSLGYITNIYQNGAFPCPNGSKLVEMNGSTDYVEVYAYQQSGLATLIANYNTHFSGFLVRAA